MTSFLARFRFSERLAPMLLVALSAVATCGAAFHVELLARLGAVDMRANTALCLLLIGVALLVRPYWSSALGVRVCVGVGALVSAVGVLTVTQYAFGIDLHIDQALFRDLGPSHAQLPGRMSLYTAIALIALGACVAGREFPRTHRFVLAGAFVPLLIGFLSLLGYLWSAEDLLTSRMIPPMAVDTAICLLLAGGAVMPDLAAFSPLQRLSPEGRIGVSLGIGFAVLIFAGAYNYRTSAAFANSNAWVTHTQEVRATLADLFATVEGSDVAARDYILTSEASKLEVFHRLREKAGLDASALARLVSDNPEQSANVALLRAAIARRETILDAALSAKGDIGVAAANSILAVSIKQISIQELQAMTSHMDEVEVRLLAAREAQSSASRSRTLLTLLLTMTVGCVVFCLMMRAVYRETIARQAAEAAARDSEATNRSIIEGSPDCMSVLTTGGTVSQINASCRQLLGLLKTDTLEGRHWSEVWDPEHVEVVTSAIQSAAAGRSSRIYISKTVSRERRWFDLIVMPLDVKDGKAIRLLCVGRDVTDLKQVESDLRAANRFLDSLFELLPVMASVKDARTFRFMRVNQASADFLGFTKAQMIGRTMGELLPDAGPNVDDADRQAVESGKLTRNPQKSVVTPVHGHRTVDNFKLPVLDESGMPLFLLTIVVDVTERKLAEDAIFALNERLQQQADQLRAANLNLAVTNKELEAANQELESFSFSVSHDLRAPLRAIDGFAEVLFSEHAQSLDAEGHRYLSIIRESSRRMGILMEDLLTFSRLGRKALQYAPIDSGALVREVIAGLTAPAANKPGAPQFLVDSLPNIRGDASLLRQVWTNLIENAVKYSSKASQPIIHVTGDLVGEEVQFAVRDNGVGFDPKYADRLFGVFQRLHTDREFEGTGVGLAIVDRIVRRHGGRIWAQSKVGSGAVFTFALPSESAPPAHDAVPLKRA